MRSQLTRHVFQNILYNEPILHQHCLYLTCRAAILHNHGNLVQPYSQRRSFFGFLRKPDRQVKDSSIAPGLEKMAEYNGKAKRGVRTPPVDELAQAFEAFFREKNSKKQAILDYEAVEALQALKNLVVAQDSAGEDETVLGFAAIPTALKALGQGRLDKPTQAHTDLAKALIQRLRQAHAEDMSVALVKDLVRALCRVRLPLEARQRLHEYHITHQKEQVSESEVDCWRDVLSGFASLNDKAELLRTVNMLRENKIPFLRNMHSIMVGFYAGRDDLANTRAWSERKIDKPPNGAEGDDQPTAACYRTLLRFCLRNNELDWGRQIFHAVMMHDTPEKKTWDIILQWAVVMGRGVEEIDRMMNIMAKQCAVDNGRLSAPDIMTINGLVKLAMSKNDPYMAERYIHLGEKWGIEPNTTTLTMQMDYRMNVGDLTGAVAAYGKLQSVEPDPSEEHDFSAVNRLIRLLAESKRYKFEDVMRIVDDLSEQNSAFEPATVATLAVLHLQREELNDAVDLLQTHAYHFPLAQRAMIRDRLVDFICDPQNGIAKAWDTYTILQHMFSETKLPTRTKLMNEFFRRKRPDMACYVFNHMKEHMNPEIKPTADTYVECLSGIAKLADEESLEVIHNAFRIDTDVEPTTRTRNALMQAYTSTGNPSRALEFWDDITSSREGPTYNSIHIAFRACEVPPLRGDTKAREIWSRLKKMDIEISPDMYASYVGAIAGNHLLDEAAALIERMEEETGHPPDAFMIGSVFNVMKGRSRQPIFASWAKEKYPEVWAELEKMGTSVSAEERWETFNVDRSIPA